MPFCDIFVAYPKNYNSRFDVTVTVDQNWLVVVVVVDCYGRRWTGVDLIGWVIDSVPVIVSYSNDPDMT